MLCPKCGAENENEDSFCSECGAQLKNNIKNKNTDSKELDKYAYFGSIELTKDEIMQSYSSIGREFYMHMFLKDISSIQLGYKSCPIFLVLAVVSLLSVFGGVCERDWFLINLGLILFFVFICIFFVTRKYTLIITAKGGEKMIEKVGNSCNAKDFVNKAIQAKKQIM